MKIFLTSAMLIFLTLSAVLLSEGYSSDICIGCEEGHIKQIPVAHCLQRISILNKILLDCKNQSIHNQLEFNYHIGYINGQLKVYQEIMNYQYQD